MCISLLLSLILVTYINKRNIKNGKEKDSRQFLNKKEELTIKYEIKTEARCFKENLFT